MQLSINNVNDDDGSWCWHPGSQCCGGDMSLWLIWLLIQARGDSVSQVDDLLTSPLSGELH